MTPEPPASIGAGDEAGVRVESQESEQKLTSILSQVAADARLLATRQRQLARAEIAAGISGYGRAVVLLLLAACFAGLTAVLLIVAAIVALAMLLGLLWSLLVIAGVCLLLAVALLVSGKATAKHSSLMPRQAVARARADIAWLRGRLDGLLAKGSRNNDR